MSAEARAEDLAAMERLWCHYLTLAQELLKFIRREDIEEFLALAAQRGKVVSDMQALLALEDRSADAQNLIGIIHIYQKQYSQAWQDFAAAAAINSTNYYILANQIILQACLK